MRQARSQRLALAIAAVRPRHVREDSDLHGPERNGRQTVTRALDLVYGFDRIVVASRGGQQHAISGRGGGGLVARVRSGPWKLRRAERPAHHVHGRGDR